METILIQAASVLGGLNFLFLREQIEHRRIVTATFGADALSLHAHALVVIRGASGFFTGELRGLLFLKRHSR